MELTPETFEKAEFVERRRGGYDIDQVETFLEETGTEFARMLVRFERRETELTAELAAAKERTEDLEVQVSDLRQKLALTADRLIDTEQRLETERAARAADAESVDAGRAVDAPHTSDDDVANVAKALVLAQEAADKTLREAKAEARAIVDGANSRSERQMAETTTKIAALVNEAKARADREYASRREAVQEEVSELDQRRESLAESISRMEARIAGYREDLRRAGEELIAVADNSAFLGDGDSSTERSAGTEASATVDADDVDGSDEEPQDEADAQPEDVAETTEATDAGDEVDDTADDTVSTEKGDEDSSADTPVDADDGDGNNADEADDSDTPSADEDQGAVDEAVSADVDTGDDRGGVQDSLEFDSDTAADDEPVAGQPSAEQPSDRQEPKIGTGWFNADDEPADSDDEPSAKDSTNRDDDAEDMLDLRSPEDRAAKSAKVEEDGGEWGPGSWSKVEKSLRAEAAESAGSDTDARKADPVPATASTAVNPAVRPERSSDSRDGEKTEAIDRVELIRDRYLEELDQAVNTELDAEDEALAAFLEGSGNSKARRFGWRR